tara:strand:+ start:301 stop:786 length:486 start_codon:yes stop_codon:yes gene_type:complete
MSKGVGKKIGQFTLRGVHFETQLGSTPSRIILFDGRFDTAWRITKFVLGPTAVSDDETTTRSWAAKLATEDSLVYDDWRWDDNREIAWSAGSYDANAQVLWPNSKDVIDPDHLIIQDLWLYANEYNEQPVNYLIEMEKYEISEWRGALAMVRSKSQNVTGA